MDVESLAKQLILKGMTEEQQQAVLDSIRNTMAQSRELQKQKVGEQAQLVIQALKKIEADIQARYDEVGSTIEKRVASIKDGKDGRDGINGRDGKDGRPGRDGARGPQGPAGANGTNGRDGVDGVSVTDAKIDFDGSLIISLSSGRTINVGEVVAPDLADKIKVITNGGGTSQEVLDTLASLQTQIDNLIPSQTGNAGKFLTTNGSVLSWASVAGGLSYQGTWNASTNTPTLASGVGTNGYYYIVATAGSTNLDGITDWQIGDWLLFNGTSWQKIDQSNLVTSVNGQTGAVTLTTTDVSEGTNLYYTDARARAALSAGTGISYSSATGVITNSAPDQTVSLTQGGTTTITGTYPNFTISSADQYVGTVTSVDTGTGLAGGPITSTGTINFSNAAVGTWAATPSSANLAAAVTDETGSGALVFGTAPTLSAPVIDGANPYIQFNNGSAVTLAAGRMWYDGSTGSWNLGMGNGNITQQIGEEIFVYGKASAAITDSPLQIVYQTGTVGASGVITFAPTVSGITNSNLIVGVATESIAHNGFGRITNFGVVHGVTTNGTAYGETWADGDVIWYNPTTGNPTKVKPVAPNIKVQVGIVLSAGSGGSGSFQVLLEAGTELGGTDSNVQITSPTNNQQLVYDSALGYWKNSTVAAGASISNDTSTATSVYPLFAAATSGTPTTIYTSNANYLYKPSIGELSAKEVRSSNGIIVNSQTITSDYTVATGDNAGSFGPISVASGVTVTVSSGSVWTVT